MAQTASPSAAPVLPAHIEQTVRAIAKLQVEHANQATTLDRLVACMTSYVARPMFAGFLVLVTIGWMIGNLVCRHMGYAVWDPPPFSWLQGAASLAALYVTVLILTTQRRDDRLTFHRDQMMLELTIITEQKTAKVIDLLEEMRRDDSALRDRKDPEAESMATTADPHAVLDAIKETHDDMLVGEPRAGQSGKDTKKWRG
jgi:uncharacterized membrane protein